MELALVAFTADRVLCNSARVRTARIPARIAMIRFLPPIEDINIKAIFASNSLQDMDHLFGIPKVCHTLCLTRGG
jgi:hypothetical protein